MLQGCATARGSCSGLCWTGGLLCIHGSMTSRRVFSSSAPIRALLPLAPPIAIAELLPLLAPVCETCERLSPLANL